jgi:hypothetical protein
VAKKKPAAPPAPKREPVAGFSNNSGGWLLYDGQPCFVFVDDEMVAIKKVPAGKQVWAAPSNFSNIRVVPGTEQKKAA